MNQYFSQREFQQQHKNREDIKADLWNDWRDLDGHYAMLWKDIMIFNDNKPQDETYDEIKLTEQSKFTKRYWHYISMVKCFWNKVKYHIDRSKKVNFKTMDGDIEETKLAEWIEEQIPKLFKIKNVSDADFFHNWFCYAVSPLFDLSTEFATHINTQQVEPTNKPDFYK